MDLMVGEGLLRLQHPGMALVVLHSDASTSF
jgi:hypothetical protein